MFLGCFMKIHIHHKVSISIVPQNPDYRWWITHSDFFSRYIRHHRSTVATLGSSRLYPTDLYPLKSLKLMQSFFGYWLTQVDIGFDCGVVSFSWNRHWSAAKDSNSTQHANQLTIYFTWELKFAAVIYCITFSSSVWSLVGKWLMSVTECVLIAPSTLKLYSFWSRSEHVNSKLFS